MDNMLQEASMGDVVADARPQQNEATASDYGQLTFNFKPPQHVEALSQQNGVMGSHHDQGNLPESQQGSEEETAKMREVYHQTPLPLAQCAAINNGDLWQFPKQTLTVHDLDHMKHVTGKRFHDTCSLVARHWEIDARLTVPPEMRAQTPYSLALLLAIRRLASHTKKDFDRGQTALLTAWRARVGRQSNDQVDSNAMQVQQTKVELGQGSEGCEDFIQETDYGLTLHDVEAASHVAKKIAKSHRAANSAPSGKVRGNKKRQMKSEEGLPAGITTRSMRRAANAQNKAAFGAEIEKRQKEPAPFAAESKISKRLARKEADKMRNKLNGDKGYKLLQFLQGDDEDDHVTLNGADGTATDTASGDVAPPNSPEPNSILTSSFADPDTVDTTMREERRSKGRANKKDKPLHANRQDRHNDDLLSQMFNRVDMASDRGPGAKKEKKLLASASKKEGSLPSDRVKLAEIPTLYAQQGPRTGLSAGTGQGVDGGKGVLANGLRVGGVPSAIGMRDQDVAVLSEDEEL